MKKELIAAYNGQFKKVAQNASFAAYTLRILHPDFYRYSVDEVKSWLLRQTKDKVKPLDPNFEFGGHYLEADSLCELEAPFADSEGNPTSLYRLNMEMQQNTRSSAVPFRRRLAYGYGLLCSYQTDQVYGKNAELITSWQQPHLKKEMDCVFTSVTGTARQDLFEAFYQDRDGWYNDSKNVEAINGFRNNPLPVMTIVDFGIPGPGSSVEAKVYYEMFLVEGSKRDYDFLSEQGLQFTEGEKKAMDKIYEYSNIFYDEGVEEGLEKGLEKGLKEGRVEGREEGLKEGRVEGRQEEREELLAKAKAADPKLYEKLYTLIHKSAPTQE